MSDPFTIFVTWLRIFKTSETNIIDLAKKLIKIVQLVHLCILQFSETLKKCIIAAFDVKYQHISIVV